MDEPGLTDSCFNQDLPPGSPPSWNSRRGTGWAAQAVEAFLLGCYPCKELLFTLNGKRKTINGIMIPLAAPNPSDYISKLTPSDSNCW